MKRHFVVFPSATQEKAAECVEAWKAKGYKTLVYLDTPDMKCGADIVSYGCGTPFPGYYRSINPLVREAFANGADLVTCIGDDMLPPTQGTERINAMYFDRFPSGLGVMQGCGDEQGKDARGVQAAARICGSPTFGIEWSNRAYLGNGAFCDLYGSYYSDEELFHVADGLELLYMEPEIKIDHAHWSWGRSKRQHYHDVASRNWNKDQQTFFIRKSEGFPGSGLKT